MPKKSRPARFCAVVHYAYRASARVPLITAPYIPATTADGSCIGV
ncbi:MAG: hypothetical protein WC766_06430 [Patescibacteria group bacterium]